MGENWFRDGEGRDKVGKGRREWIREDMKGRKWRKRVIG